MGSLSDYVNEKGDEIVSAIDAELGANWQSEVFKADIDSKFLPTEYTIDSTNPRKVSNTGGSTYFNLFAVVTDALPTTGRYYWEIHLGAGSVNNARFGVTDSGQRLNGSSDVGGTEFADTHGIGISESNQLIIDGTTNLNSGAGAFVSNDIIAFAYDADTGELWADVNAAPNTSNAALATKTDWPGNVHIALNLREDGCEAEVVVKSSDLAYTIPATYTALGDVLTSPYSLSDITDVDTSGATTGQVLKVQSGGDYAFEDEEVGIFSITKVTGQTTLTLSESEQGHMIEAEGNTDGVPEIKIPDDATDNLPIGYTVNLTVTLDNGPTPPSVGCSTNSTTLNGVALGNTSLNGGVYTGATLYKSAADTWIIQGSHSAVT